MSQFRNTVQKEEIYAALTRLASHPTADDVYDCVHIDYPKISRATVYRDLNQMADNGRILRINVPGGATHFDHRNRAHHHVHCVRCGRVCDISGDVDVLFDYSAVSAPDFRIISYCLIFDGVCSQCDNV